MIADQSDISSVYLADDELVTVLPVGHPLDGPVSLSALADESFILMNRYTSVYQICQALVRKCAGPPTDSKNRTCRIDHQRRCHRGGRKPPSIQ